jgi:hypothetical protein
MSPTNSSPRSTLDDSSAAAVTEARPPAPAAPRAAVPLSRVSIQRF